MYSKLGISEEIQDIAKQTEQEVKEVFVQIEKNCELNSLKVLNAFQKYEVSEMHFNGTTGYGYGDVGRDTIEKIFAEILEAEDSLVRTQIISGTHALTVCLFGLLRPGDTLLSISGKPYDTLDSVIGISENTSSLKAFDINYEQIDLIQNEFNKEEILKRVEKGNLKVITIQRSRGYALRDSICIDKMEEIIKAIKEKNKEVIIMVDNCYGEFVSEKEPLAIGADIIVRFFNKEPRRRTGSKWWIYSRKTRFSRIM